MTEVEPRLERCFAAVFTDLRVADLRTASVETVSAWNSLSAVTLVSVIEEEFGVNIGLLDLADLDSFEAFRRYLSEKLVSHTER